MAGVFQQRTVRVADTEYAYQLWLPPGWCGHGAWPIVLFLHGAGEKGDDAQRQTTVGLGPALQAQSERWPFLAVFPQCRERQAWRGEMLTQAVAALDEAILATGADAGRQYLTGISMGGYGSWRLALDYPDRFAALVPICGGLDASPGVLDRALARTEHPPAAEPASHPPSGRHATDQHAAAARTLAHLSTWIFHGAADDVIPVCESRVMHEAMRAAGADVRYTEYPALTHDSWTRAYAEEELPAWMAKQRR